MREKLITHYQLASLVESKNPKKDSIRKMLAKRILANVHNVTDTERANVLTSHSLHFRHIERIAQGNAIRREAKNNGLEAI
jgi:hypothetical protein